MSKITSLKTITIIAAFEMRLFSDLFYVISKVGLPHQSEVGYLDLRHLPYTQQDSATQGCMLTYREEEKHLERQRYCNYCLC